MRMDESHLEMTLRWHLYRRWRANPQRIAFQKFHKILRSAPADALALDCGANNGEVTAALLRSGLRVIAFEPDPVALQTLTPRFKGDPRVKIIPKAIGGSDRVAPFYQHISLAEQAYRTEATSLLQFEHHTETPSGTVDVVNIDRFIRELGEPVFLMKIDIEGAEAEVIESLLDSRLYREIGHIFVETHERFSDDLARRIAAIRRTVAEQGITNIDLDWP